MPTSSSATCGAALEGALVKLEHASGWCFEKCSYLLTKGLAHMQSISVIITSVVLLLLWNYDAKGDRSNYDCCCSSNDALLVQG